MVAGSRAQVTEWKAANSDVDAVGLAGIVDLTSLLGIEPAEWSIRVIGYPYDPDDKVGLFLRSWRLRGAVELPCCDLHNVRCEPPAELCCHVCAEIGHPDHFDMRPCVLVGQDAL